jgi:hypothetical protein
MKPKYVSIFVGLIVLGVVTGCVLTVKHFITPSSIPDVFGETKKGVTWWCILTIDVVVVLAFVCKVILREIRYFFDKIVSSKPTGTEGKTKDLFEILSALFVSVLILVLAIYVIND